VRLLLAEPQYDRLRYMLRCDWHAIGDKQRFLDLSNPFEVEEHWRDVPIES